MGEIYYISHDHSSTLQAIQVTFSAFSLEYDSDCYYDGVRLYDDEVLVSTECNDLPADFTSSGGRARVEFYSDGSITDTGFSATVTFVDVIPPPPPPPPGTCGPPPGPCPNITKVTRLIHYK